MLKKMKIVISAINFFAFTFLFSGCGLLPYYQNPKKIVIEDVEYVSGFYDNLYVIGIEYKELSTSLFTIKNHHFWHLDDSPFDIYYGVHKEALTWNPILYCQKEEYDEVNAYYHNLDNFDYYIGLYLDKESIVKLDDNIDRGLIEKAVELAIADGNKRVKGYQKLTLYLDGKNYTRPVVFRQSNDNIFTTTQSEWIFYENNLYKLEYLDGSNDKYHLFALDIDVNDYIASILNQYDLS